MDNKRDSIKWTNVSEKINPEISFILAPYVLRTATFLTLFTKEDRTSNM